jgi:predicted metal-dependent phosphoesterase TrpH
MGLDVICITDHNEIDGAFEVASLGAMPVIIGEEVKTTHGEIIGLFLQQWIAPQQSPEATIDQIRAQGGLVYVPHPFDSYRGSRLRFEKLVELVDQIDILEVFNARNLRNTQNTAARAFARKHNLLLGAGSDSHTVLEIGHAFVAMPPFEGALKFKESLRSGVPHGRLTNPLVHVITRFDKTYKRLKRPHAIAGARADR